MRETDSCLRRQDDAVTLAEQSWQVQDIKTGIAQAEQGEFASEEEVAAVFARHGA